MNTDPRRAAVQAFVDAERAFGVAEIPVRVEPPMADTVAARRAKLIALEQAAERCTDCMLHRTRTKLVFGDGSPVARLVFVGEAPGRDEDLQGKPFVGRAGQLLTKMIEAIGMRREDVYICNVLKDRPPQNRPPEPNEVAACRHWLQAQLKILRPQVLCTLGTHAVTALLGAGLPIMKLRGTWQAWEGIPLMPTLHPAYLLRNASAKKLVWEDLKAVRDRIKQAA